MEGMKTSLLLVWVLLNSVRCSGAPLNVCTANVTESNNGSLVVLYTRLTAYDNSSCMHFVWNTRGNYSSGYPTLFASQTINDNGVCTSHCSNYLNSSDNSVNIPDAVESYFSFGMVFTRVIEFLVDSTKAQAVDKFNATQSCHCEMAPKTDVLCKNYSKNYLSTYLDGDNITWGYDKNEQSFVATLIDPVSGNVSDTKIHIKPNFPSSDQTGQRLSIFPHTPFTANSTIVDLVIENYDYKVTNASDKESKNYSRLALEVYLVHGPHTHNGSVSTYVSLDDEYTPSVFKTMTYETPFDKDESRGFFQWKPISYQSPSRKSTESQQVNIVYTASVEYCNFTSIPEGLAAKLFMDSASNVTRWFAVFGTPGDQTFLPSEYMTWTSLIGYGTAPQDTVSIVVIITIIVGLGVPALLVLLGGVYVVYKKKPWENVKRAVTKVSGQRSGYTRLN